MFLIVNGVHIVENLRLENLAAEHAYETAFHHGDFENQGRHRLDGSANRGSLTTTAISYAWRRS